MGADGRPHARARPGHHGTDSPGLADPLVVLEGSARTARALPPFFVPCGTADPLLDDTRRLAAAVRARGAVAEDVYYPGDDYVDIVGISVFGLQKWDQDKFGRDRSYNDVMEPRYRRAAAFGKPVVVAELGYSGDQAYVDSWENSVRVARPDLQNLVGVVYFDQREVYPWPASYGLPDWRINNRVIKE